MIAAQRTQMLVTYAGESNVEYDQKQTGERQTVRAKWRSSCHVVISHVIPFVRLSVTAPEGSSRYLFLYKFLDVPETLLQECGNMVVIQGVVSDLAVLAHPNKFHLPKSAQ